MKRKVISKQSFLFLFLELPLHRATNNGPQVEKEIVQGHAEYSPPERYDDSSTFHAKVQGPELQRLTVPLPPVSDNAER